MTQFTKNTRIMYYLLDVVECVRLKQTSAYVFHQQIPVESY